MVDLLCSCRSEPLGVSLSVSVLWSNLPQYSSVPGYLSIFLEGRKLDASDLTKLKWPASSHVSLSSVGIFIRMPTFVFILCWALLIAQWEIILTFLCYWFDFLTSFRFVL